MDRETKHHSLLAHELSATGEGFHAALVGLQADQWNFRPEEGVWSILEIAEHVALVEDGIARLLIEKLADKPLSEDERRGLKSRDTLVTTVLFDRKTRMPAPERIKPTGRYGDPMEAAAVFESTQARLLEWLEETPLDLRAHGSPHPMLGMLDGKQWLLFAAAHTERHTRQILEVKKDPRYPG